MKIKLYNSISTAVKSEFDRSYSKLRGKTSGQIIRSEIKLKNIGFFEYYTNSIENSVSLTCCFIFEEEAFLFNPMISRIISIWSI
jgi:hypothetical protein